MNVRGVLTSLVMWAATCAIAGALEKDEVITTSIRGDLRANGRAYTGTSPMCKNALGENRDWWVILTQPGDGGYFYLDDTTVESGQFSHMPGKVSAHGGALGQTLEPLYLPETPGSVAHVMYSNSPPVATQKPDSQHEAAGRGHGVLAADDVAGFWILHSIPGYPAAAESSSMPGPVPHEVESGHSAVCYTLTAGALGNLTAFLARGGPHIFSSSSPKNRLLGALASASVARGAAPAGPLETSTIGGEPVVVFLQAAQSEPLWDSVLPAYFGTPMAVRAPHDGGHRSARTLTIREVFGKPAPWFWRLFADEGVWGLTLSEADAADAAASLAGAGCTALRWGLAASGAAAQAAAKAMRGLGPIDGSALRELWGGLLRAEPQPVTAGARRLAATTRQRHQLGSTVALPHLQARRSALEKALREVVSLQPQPMTNRRLLVERPLPATTTAVPMVAADLAMAEVPEAEAPPRRVACFADMDRTAAGAGAAGAAACFGENPRLWRALRAAASWIGNC